MRSLPANRCHVKAPLTERAAEQALACVKSILDNPQIKANEKLVLIESITLPWRP